MAAFNKGLADGQALTEHHHDIENLPTTDPDDTR